MMVADLRPGANLVVVVIWKVEQKLVSSWVEPMKLRCLQTTLVSRRPKSSSLLKGICGLKFCSLKITCYSLLKKKYQQNLETILVTIIENYTMLEFVEQFFHKENVRTSLWFNIMKIFFYTFFYFYCYFINLWILRSIFPCFTSPYNPLTSGCRAAVVVIYGQNFPSTQSWFSSGLFISQSTK